MTRKLIQAPASYSFTLTNSLGDIVHMTPAEASRHLALGIRKNATRRSDWHYSFKTHERALEHARNWLASRERAEAAKKAERARRARQKRALKAADHWAVGDVVSNSWGYDQTNVDWYQVTEVKAKSIVIRRIGSKRLETAYMSGKTQPDRYNYTGEPIVKHLREDGGIRFEFGAARKWDGKAQYCSWYA